MLETGISTNKPANATRPTRRSVGAQNGFTLLELLVVAFIIAIMAGAAVLSMGVVGADRESKREAERLKTLLQLVQDESLMQGRDFGVLLGESGYRFYLYDYATESWVEPLDDNLLKDHRLKSPIMMELALDGRFVSLDREPGEDAAETVTPHITLLSSGEMTPFELAFVRDLNGPRYLLTGELNGSLEVELNDVDL